MKEKQWIHEEGLIKLESQKEALVFYYLTCGGAPPMWCKKKRYKISLDLHPQPLCKLNQNKRLAFSSSSSPSGSSPIASENNRTTFGPPQPPCKP